ncbi:hypothetical protein BU17DRAFT_34141, partial [Hysterangium stoloniferum]
YIFGPWQNRHCHNFSFVRRITADGGPRSFGPPREVLLKVCDLQEEENPSTLVIYENNVKLEEVYSETGGYHSAVTLGNNRVAPLIYEYDFGDCWEHKITFLKAESARAERPLVKEAVGCGPVDDSGGIKGWNAVK